jgi:hypothetical protein
MTTTGQGSAMKWRVYVLTLSVCAISTGITFHRALANCWCQQDWPHPPVCMSQQDCTNTGETPCTGSCLSNRAIFKRNPKGIGKGVGRKINSVTSYIPNPADPTSCSGSCSGFKTYYWSCDADQYCGLNCTAKPPYGYCYVEGAP